MGKDIGHHFPDSDAKYRDIDSRHLLRLIVEMVGEKLLVENLRYNDYRTKTQDGYAYSCDETSACCRLACQLTQVNIKATRGIRCPWT